MEKTENKAVSFITLGCKVNQYETNAMIQQFVQNGYTIVDTEDKSQICIVNTCTVTNMSDRKSRQMLRKFKQKNPNSIIVAVGCYAQVAKTELEKMEEIDLVLGNNEKKDIVKYVEKYIKENEIFNQVTDVMHQKEFVDFGSITYTDRNRAVVKIQDGCDRFCSYCIIPYARGRVRSRQPQSIIEEIEKLAQNGEKEIIITGIHIASYGKDFKNRISLIDLSENIDNIKGIERIRLGSLEPTLITDEFIERLSKLNHICHHFHLSLQSGSNDTLKRMNRKYTTEEFEEIVNRIRNKYDNAILTTDIIVGFPGETEKEFTDTYNFLKKIAFYKMHVFPYSPRKGTKAAEMPEQIDGNTKEKRSKKLIELSNEKQLEYNEKYIGKEIQVLWEEREGEYLKGHSENYILVKYKTMENLENTLSTVTIKKADTEFIEA